MKKYISLLITVIVCMILVVPEVYSQDTIRNEQSEKVQKQKFVDEDGDGYNDNAPDHDGDGIPNRFDQDWKKLQKKTKKPFVDLNGDGVNDNLQEGEGSKEGQREMKTGDESGSSMQTKEQNQYRKGSGKKGRNK